MGISGDSYLFCGSRVLPPHWEEVTLEELCWGHPCSFSSLWRVVGVAQHVVLGIWACVLPQESRPKSCFVFFFSWAVALYCIQSCIFSEERDESAEFQSPQFLLCLPHLTTSPTRDWTWAPAVGVQSPNHWTTKEAPKSKVLILGLWKRTWFINAFV